ncbi:hypothetical protein GUITHDRAFT_153906 [Guillardia theta CCMP2712]|uniref:Cyclic nucleotide-binding domain-containing protein n=2 Tax=Guillardia theta TaxID=55529 RepID=L1IYK1_GUITC|nr:hypothetical protein GUITHDRAFT_153906 [Guillardia theta CCMP2712]EKX41296.1 hypothetical protein GUITHDRAFT_153906 [Guillardia theta CCMP2712]|mmetsp:Transcript_51332/g.160280  ORF Transcript_51332/g.160280 Transcript_51332/m.160280 type:complete len:324 (+) Transcript_51332:355-1326(+)|eukprot:XP_005828276.1 hypothetical protein GUITHDRAFT_153906 [Guillardia theta CCMP2712]
MEDIAQSSEDSYPSELSPTAKLALQRLANASTLIRSNPTARRRCFPLNELQSAWMKKLDTTNSRERISFIPQAKRVMIESDGAECMHNIMAVKARMQEPATTVAAGAHAKLEMKEGSCASRSCMVEEKGLSDAEEMALSEKMAVLVQSPLVKARHVHESCIKAIAKKLQVERFHEGDLIVQHGTVGKDIYWVASGECVCEVDGHAVDLLSAGFCFGEMSVIKLSKLIQGGVPEKEAMDQCHRQADVLAAGDVVLLKLAYDDSTNLMRIVPNLWMTLVDLGAARSRRIDNFRETQQDDEEQLVHEEEQVISSVTDSIKSLPALE